jgi:hypothetical protein
VGIVSLSLSLFGVAAAVPAGSDLQRRWLNDLAESENEMRAAETRREAALETLRMADDEVRTAVRAL